MRLLPILSIPILAVGLAAQGSWSVLYPAVSPPPRGAFAMAGLGNAGVFLFGGLDSSTSTTFDDCWRLQGNVWTQLGGLRPTARAECRFAEDTARQRLVMFGGNNGGTWFPETWEFTGTQWIQFAPAAAPSARGGHSMAYDPIRQVTVLFGGYEYSSQGATWLQDVWEWNGTTWSLRSTSGGPGPRHAAMAFDPVSRQVLLFGGYRPNTIFQDTWLWNGSTWTQRFPTTPPPMRADHRLVTDPRRARVLLQGGYQASEFAWEWDGNEWSMLVQPSPSVRVQQGLAYDAAAGRIVMFGGISLQNVVNDTWQFRTPNPADAVAFGSGCASSAGVPELANAPYTYPWLGDTYTSELRNLPAATSPVIFFSGFTQVGPVDLGPLGMPGCQQWVDLTFSQPAAAADGVATWTVAVPNVTALSGLHLFQQGAVLAPGTNTLGAVVSNALDLTAGIR